MSERLDLLLVNAPSRLGVYGELAPLTAIEPPVWAGLIATYCLERGYTVQILDAEAEGMTAEQAASEIHFRLPRLAVFCIYGHQPSASTQCLPGASATARHLRHINADGPFEGQQIKIPTLALGTHPSALPERTLREEPFDYVCQGEGPETVAGLIEALRNDFNGISTVPGLWGRFVHKTVIAPYRAASNITDLDAKLPRQAWELLDMSKYTAHNWHLWSGDSAGGYASVQTSLGCPYACSFCVREGTTIVTLKGVNKSVEQIVSGEKLLAWDEKAQQISETTVVNTASRLADKLLRISTLKESVEMTGEHPVYTARGWVKAEELNKEDKILVMERKDKVRYLRRFYPHPITSNGRARISERMKRQNPMKRADVVARVSASLKLQRERLSKAMVQRWATGRIVGRKQSIKERKNASDRMRKNNPMHRPEVVAKAMLTYRSRYASGDIIPFACTAEGKRVIAAAARKRTLSSDNPMKNPSIARHPTLLAKRSARMRALWANAELAQALMDTRPTGEDHPNWRGGASSPPYPLTFSPRMKRRVRSRDKDTCQNCGATAQLSVHHIDYVKDNLDDCNLITLCVSCNSKANFNRQHWQQLYTSKMLSIGQCPHFEEITDIQEVQGEFRVHNFECAPHDNYWAGFLLVHNCCINSPFGGRGIRYWSPRNVAQQIERLVYDYGITNLKIPDEMFVLNPKHVRGICDELIARKLGDRLNMWAYARVDTVKDPVMLSKMRQAGFRWLGIGIESGSKHVRDGVEKGRFGDEDIEAALQRVRDAGLHIAANYIFGLPDDTQETMQQTLALACHLNTEMANFYCAMAYPGSPLHAQVSRDNPTALPENNSCSWIGYSQHAYESLPLPTETLTAQQVLDFRDEAWMYYFTRPVYFDMMRRTFGQGVVNQVLEMAGRGKPRRRHRDTVGE